MKPETADKLVQTIRDAPTTPNVREAARAQLDVILVDDLTRSLAQLSADIQQAQKILGTRVTELTDELRQSSASSSTWARALVVWTAGLVVVTVVYTVFAGINVFRHCP